jgi:hypothetical protein
MATSTRADGRVGWCAGRASRLAGVNMFRPPPTRLHGDPADLGSRVTGIRGHRVLVWSRAGSAPLTTMPLLSVVAFQLARGVSRAAVADGRFGTDPLPRRPYRRHRDYPQTRLAVGASHMIKPPS